jgi:hypothetical protein
LSSGTLKSTYAWMIISLIVVKTLTNHPAAKPLGHADRRTRMRTRLSLTSTSLMLSLLESDMIVV